MPYNPQSIEPRWQAYWAKHGSFRAEIDPTKPKFYVLDMFPYPSGAGLHVGHPLGYTATDILCRYKRMRGFNVLHPMGWDSFGLPAERHAMRTGIHPAVTTKRNIENFRKQVQRLGFSYDWTREITTTDAGYVRWTQWIFLKLFERGLAYQAEVPVNWCPAQNTVLADEEVNDGRYVETGDPVVRRRMRQWMLRITAYADRLLEGLDGLDWPESLKTMQRNWIGRSEGTEIAFPIEHSRDYTIIVFTTRPETLFGATYLVVAPEHPMLTIIATPQSRDAVEAYAAQAEAMGVATRAEIGREKTGVFTGAYAINPANGALLPIWVADYVLGSYGTGATMGVPAHDGRDHAFASAFNLPVIPIVDGEGDVQQASYEGNGRMMNSGFLDGLSVSGARHVMVAWLQSCGAGKPMVTYRMRDWLFSRQRYWGEPIPVLHLADGSVVPLPEDCLPLLLPELDDYAPTTDGQPPLTRLKDWVRTTVPGTDIPAQRETNTMPQWAGSCWYYLRFLDPHNENELVGREAQHYWMPVDVYVGGAEHAVLHLLYARFWYKILYDIGAVTTDEPFQRLFNQGMILAPSYRDSTGRYYEPSAVVECEGRWFSGTVEVTSTVEKMSKSHLNVVNPDDVVDEFGADAMRLYEMFMGPLGATKPWHTTNINGVRRFLERAWRIVCNECDELHVAVRDEPALPDLLRLRHRTVGAVTDDIEAMRFNTSVARLMELANALTAATVRPRAVVETFVLLLAPFAPHLAEELWRKLGHEGTLTYVPWPDFDPALAQEQSQEYVVQVNGKVRHRFRAVEGLGPAVLAAARSEPAVMALLGGKVVIKEIVVPGRLVNFVLEE
jgi:leucyl-tRNA synthetase